MEDRSLYIVSGSACNIDILVSQAEKLGLESVFRTDDQETVDRIANQTADSQQQVFEDSYMLMNMYTHQVARVIDGQYTPIDLTDKEWFLLEYLVDHREDGVQQSMLAQEMYGDATKISVVKKYIQRLRHKLGDERPFRHIVNYHGSPGREGSYRYLSQ